MQAVILLALLVVVVSCDDGGVERSADIPDEQRQEVVSDASVDPFAEGSSYRFVMTTKSTPGLEKSSAEVKVFIREFVGSEDSPTKEKDVTDTDDGDSDGETAPSKKDDNTSKDTRKLASNAKVQLNWVCGDKEYRGTEKVAMDSLDTKLNVSLKELPALEGITESIKCELDATLDTTKADGERVIATGSHEFYIEMDVLYPALQLDNVEITYIPEDDTSTPTVSASSTVAFKVTLIRQGKAVVKGDPVFDKDVEVELSWDCNDAPVANDRSKSSAPTDLTIAAGSAEGQTQLNNLPNTILGESGYACLITATAEIEGYEHDVEGKKKVWIEGKDLQVAVTSVSNNSLSYVVMKRYQRLTGNVKLTLVDCPSGITLINNDVSSQGSVGIEGARGGTCKLKAQLMIGGIESRAGESKPFSIPSTAFKQMEKI